MSDPFIGEIRMVGFNWAPQGWALCDGQLLPISSNTALFSLIGTTYGGDGRTTFALPDLRGRVPVHQGQGAGLTPRPIGQRAGQQAVTLLANQMPSHNHQATALARANSGSPATGNPANAVLCNTGFTNIYNTSAPNVNMHADSVQVTVGNAGANQAHDNMQPFLVVNFAIALVGLYPSRS